MTAGPKQEGHALADSPAQEASDAARWWQAYSLAENDEADELRQRASAGDDHALYELSGWLAAHGRLTELRELISTEGGLAALQTFWRTSRSASRCCVCSPTQATMTPSGNWHDGSPDRATSRNRGSAPRPVTNTLASSCQTRKTGDRHHREPGTCLKIETAHRMMPEA